ncbi:MAG: hypothetical protein AAFU73_12930 [Planctomycetota bacterium]
MIPTLHPAPSSLLSLVLACAPAVAAQAVVSVDPSGAHAAAAPSVADPGRDDGEDRAGPATLLAVDSEGATITDVSFALRRSVPGALEPVAEIVRTGADGRVLVPVDADGLGPVDIEVGPSSADTWALRFLHASRAIQTDAGLDAAGRPLVTLAPGGEHVAVLVPTGTLRLEIAGAEPDERFVATFVDERPEPFFHRNVRTSRAFEGPSAALHLPPGRGYLHLARESALGGYVQCESGSLLVAVRPGATTLLRIAFTQGPLTTLQAPFESIPFDTVELLGLDGQTVAGALAFDASPLRIPSSLPHVVGLDREGDALARGSRAKAPLRARGVPIVREQPGVFANSGIPGYRLANAPVQLVFGVDVGRKVRLPQDMGGWMQLMQAGVSATSPASFRGGPLVVERPRPGELRLAPDPRLGGAVPLGGLDAHTVVVVDSDGRPLPLREVVVQGPDGAVGHPATRAITDAEGRLRLLWNRPLEVRPVDRARSVQTAQVDGSGTVRVAAEDAGARVRGTWEGAPTGTVLTLSLGSEGDRATVPPWVAVTDSRGHFDFGRVPPGPARVVAGVAPNGRSAGRAEDALVPADGVLQLTLSGPPGSARMKSESRPGGG